MTQFAQFLILGLGTGGIYALIGIGVVLVYRGSGVVNFAHGAMALFGLVVFYETREALGTWGAVAAAVLLSAALGILVQLLVMHPLRHASPLVRVIATLALMTAFQQAAEIQYSGVPVYLQPILPADTWFVGDVAIPQDRIYLLAITLVLAAVIWAAYRYTRFGIATTAVTENPRAVASLGWSPNVLSIGNWALGGALAGLAGCLVGPITSLDPVAVTLIVVPGLAASLVGRFSSLWMTVAGGLLIGVLESETTHFVSAPGWFSAVPFLVIILVLVVRGRALPLRSERAERLPSVGLGTLRPPVVVISFGLAVASLFAFGISWTESITSAAIFGLVCLSVIVVTGYCGQLSLAQFALAGIGALAAAKFAVATHLSLVVALPIGVATAVVAGLVIALPAVRVRGVNLAVVTLGLAVVTYSVILSNSELTGGILGIVIEPATVFGVDVSSILYPERYSIVALVVLTVCLILTANLRRGRAGRRLIAVRNNERAAASLGINVPGAKLFAFGLSAAFAGAAGVLAAFRTTNVVFDGYAPLASVSAVLYAVIGGVGYLGGAIMGGISTGGGPFNELISKILPTTDDWYLLVMALLIVVILIANPHGIVGEFVKYGQAIRARVPRRGSSGSASWAPPDSVAPAKVVPQTLDVEGLSVRFGGVHALDSLDLHVEPGQIVGLIGPNGAGKTTAVDAISGFLGSYQGTVSLGGRRIDRLGTFRRARAGISRSFQSLELFDDLTVADNLRAAADGGGRRAYLSDLLTPGRPVLPSAAVVTVREFGLEGVLDSMPAELPYAQRRLVAIARAVTASPSILMLDEPASGLDENSTAELAQLLRRLAQTWGIGILLIEHDMSLVMDVCDRIEVIDFGKKIASGSPGEVRHDHRVVEAYLGAPEDDPGERRDATAVPAVAGSRSIHEGEDRHG